MSTKLFTIIDRNVSRIGFLSSLVDKALNQLVPNITASAATCQTLLNYSVCFRRDSWQDAPAKCGGQGQYSGRWGTVYYYANGRKVYLGSYGAVCVYNAPPSCPSSTCS